MNDMEPADSTKNRISRVDKDPWACILGRRPESYQIPEIGNVLMQAIDQALFERKLERAIRTGVVLEKWAERLPHFACKAQAVLGSVFTIAGMPSLAEEKLLAAKGKTGGCRDCLAQYHKRLGTFLVYSGDPSGSMRAYDQAVKLFAELGDKLEEAKALLNRGVTRSILHDFNAGLKDQEYAVDLLRSAEVASNGKVGIYFVAASVNIAAILAQLGVIELARKKIEEIQEMLKGQDGVERARIILRWVRALLFEQEGGYRNAGQILDRVEGRLRKLEMNSELRVLLADRARVARHPPTVIRIARKALDMETKPAIRAKIERVIREPIREAILEWRAALDSYVPPFPAGA